MFRSPSQVLAIHALLLTAGPAIIGCAPMVEEKVAEAVVTSALETSRNGGVGRSITELHQPHEQGCVQDPVAAAADAAARPPVGLFPDGCLQKTAEGPWLHADFDRCTGVFGRVELSGGMDALFEPAASDCLVHADITDRGDFTANERPLDYEAAADIRYEDGHRDVDWAAHWRGTTRRGRHVEQSSSLNVLVDEQTSCLDIVGSTEGRVGPYEFATTIDGLTICPEACPASGEVWAELRGKLRDRSITVIFDGSNLAIVEGWTGRTFEVEMVCSPES